MILFFDCETTGKADFRAPPDSKHQPWLVQIAALLTDDAGKEMATLSAIVKPEGYSIPSEAVSIHGITTEIATDYGIGREALLPMFAQLAGKPKVICAHNVQFDLFIITSEYVRAGFDEVPTDGAVPFCTMKQMTDICNLSGPYGPKWPKLAEAHRHAFNSDFEGAHDAMADVRACAKVYWWLKAQREAKKP